MVRIGVHQLRTLLRSGPMATGRTMSATAMAVGVMKGSATMMNSIFFMASKARGASIAGQARELLLCTHSILIG